MKNVLSINNLTVAFDTPKGEQVAVNDASLVLGEGETLALVGESGCGKTVLCKSLLNILCSRGSIRAGQISVAKDEIAMVFQDPMTSLDPAFSVGEQIAEAVRIHGIKASDGSIAPATANEAKKRALELMKLVSISDAESRYSQRPYQFSGGMRQRIVIAIALASNPQILLADEPTTALDEETQREILSLIKDVQRATGVAILFITHDLSLVSDMADRVAIMKDGSIVETGRVAEVLENPSHDYTKKLLGYLNYSRGIGHSHGGHGAAVNNTSGTAPEAILKVTNLSKSYRLSKGTAVQVLDNFNMSIDKGEIVGVVGKSGCGKTTLARCLMSIEKPDSGEIGFADNVNVQMIFQDSGFAFNDRLTIEQIIAEPLVISGLKKRSLSKVSLHEEVLRVMSLVKLPVTLLSRKPYELSGGQRQRVAIARALITKPDFIIADEPLTGLDVSAQAQIVHLLKDLSETEHLTILFIAHDLPMVNHISDRIVFM